MSKKLDRFITIRVDKRDLEKFNKAAMASGLPRQVILRLMMRKFVNGEFKINLTRVKGEDDE